VITVATWNVLHRVHAENWGEDVARHWPNESERITAITALLAARTEQVIALQEVSGDQLADLRRALPGRTIHTMRYPRVPKPRHGDCSLRDPAEYLVLVVDGPGQEIAAESFPDDPGKGALVVRISETDVVSTHVSGDQRRTHQLARLVDLASHGHSAVLLGDFNTDRATVASSLGHDFVVADLPPDALPTRPGSRSTHIDHVVVRGAVAAATVEAVDHLSDHNLVRATVSWRARG
jgi:endonuclease/exonuclease/phosphatase family metal-dependent hydrolase